MHDQQGPALTQKVERHGQRAVLIVGACRHAIILATLFSCPPSRTLSEWSRQGAVGGVAMPAADDDGAAAEVELRATVLAYPPPLDEPERRVQPGDRLADVGVDQDRGHGR